MAFSRPILAIMILATVLACETMAAAPKRSEAAKAAVVAKAPSQISTIQSSLTAIQLASVNKVFTSFSALPAASKALLAVKAVQQITSGPTTLNFGGCNWCWLADLIYSWSDCPCPDGCTCDTDPYPECTEGSYLACALFEFPTYSNTCVDASCEVDRIAAKKAKVVKKP